MTSAARGIEWRQPGAVPRPVERCYHALEVTSSLGRPRQRHLPNRRGARPRPPCPGRTRCPSRLRPAGGDRTRPCRRACPLGRRAGDRRANAGRTWPRGRDRTRVTSAARRIHRWLSGAVPRPVERRYHALEVTSPLGGLRQRHLPNRRGDLLDDRLRFGPHLTTEDWRAGRPRCACHPTAGEGGARGVHLTRRSGGPLCRAPPSGEIEPRNTKIRHRYRIDDRRRHIHRPILGSGSDTRHAARCPDRPSQPGTGRP